MVSGIPKISSLHSHWAQGSSESVPKKTIEMWYYYLIKYIPLFGWWFKKLRWGRLCFPNPPSPHYRSQGLKVIPSLTWFRKMDFCINDFVDFTYCQCCLFLVVVIFWPPVISQRLYGGCTVRERRSLCSCISDMINNALKIWDKHDLIISI